MYLIKEVQRLKEIEKVGSKTLEWQMKRSLARTNYRIHTDAIQAQLVNFEMSDFQKNLIYALEADMLNLIMFGQTAKEWEITNPELKKQGLNMRDVAEI